MFPQLFYNVQNILKIVILGIYDQYFPILLQLYCLRDNIINDNLSPFFNQYHKYFKSCLILVCPFNDQDNSSFI